MDLILLIDYSGEKQHQKKTGMQLRNKPTLSYLKESSLIENRRQTLTKFRRICQVRLKLII